MYKPFPKIFYWLFPAIAAIAGLIYIYLVIQPELYFHHQQNPFVFSRLFINSFLKYPGGIAELFANFLAQFLYFPKVGPFVLLGIIFLISWLLYKILETFSGYQFNKMWSFIPAIFAITLFNNYAFPLSVVISVLLNLTVLLVLVKAGKNIPVFLILYIAGAVIVYYCCGSGYLIVFSASSSVLIPKCKLWLRLTAILAFAGFTFLFADFASDKLFALPSNEEFFFFYSFKPFFIQYQPSLIFAFFIFSIPVLLLILRIYSAFFKEIKVKKLKINPLPVVILVFILVVLTGYISHHYTFNSDSKKIVASDYYCYRNEPDKTARAATTLKDYNFAANLNYNLVMSKTGSLTENAFGFMQINGTESLHPDIDFASELCFISADFYYNLGFISEAKHWAYESLVFYPYSTRAMELLVKIHLVTHEYKAAQRYLKIMGKGIVSRKFVNEYQSLVQDSTLIRNHPEIAEKRSFIPAEGELSPFIETRFKQLLEANQSNKKAYEHLMLYYLLSNQFEKFNSLFDDRGKYFDKTSAVYEEAILMHAFRKQQPVPVNIKISGDTENRFNSFTRQLEQFKGKTRQARNALYKEFGKTYMYFIQFVYPNIIETEIVSDENDYPAI